MQSAKDSFYAALRDRFHERWPAAQVNVRGVLRAPIYVAENMATNTGERLDCFVVRFGAPALMQAVGPNEALWRMECEVSYATQGRDASGCDRGRTLAEMDEQLSTIVWPRHAAKQDFSSGTPVALGTNVFWSQPAFSETKSAGQTLARSAKMTIHFFSEVTR